MKNKRLLPKLICVGFLPMGALLFYLSSFIPQFIENIYSNGINRFTRQILSLITGFIPFSIAELIVVFLFFFTIWRSVQAMIMVFNGKLNRQHIILNFLIRIFILVGAVYFGFVVLWGLNYNRLPFSKIAHLDTRPASVKELAEVCESIIARANQLRSKVNEDTQGVMHLPNGKLDALNRAYKGYMNAAKIYPELGGRYGRPKAILLSKAMCFTGITGVYFPFTAEANVNTAITDAMIPCTASHEMAHQRGFSREDEANYIAYLTSSMHPDVDFQYSGTLLALIHVMNALYHYDQDKYNQLRKKYSEGIQRDLTAMREFWKKYEGPIEDISSAINDAYLKANRQKDGIYSYGRMVDLLIAEHRLKAAK